MELKLTLVFDFNCGLNLKLHVSCILGRLGIGAIASFSIPEIAPGPLQRKRILVTTRVAWTDVF